MSRLQIAFTEVKTVRADMTVAVDAGQRDVMFVLPDAVPAGQKLVLNISISGRYVDESKAPVERFDEGSVVK